jgi:hypothetical protein
MARRVGLGAGDGCSFLIVMCVDVDVDAGVVSSAEI